MKCILPISVLISAIALSGCNTLEDKEQTLQLYYVSWACDCANWATLADIDKYQNMPGDSLANHCIFLEPASDDLALPDSASYNYTTVKVIGRFYENKGFPKDYCSAEQPEKARVFRYTSYKMVHSISEYPKTATQ